jgi:cytochrome c
MSDNYKIYGAVLGTALMVFGLQSLSGLIYNSELPATPGYKVEVAAAEGSGKAGAKPPAAESLGAMLAKADAGKGQAVAKACAACHDFTKGGPNKTGPNLWDIVDRAHASQAGFTYSEAMAAKKGEPWSYAALDAFLKSPKEVVPGTKMSTFGGVKKDQQRADLLAYLATLSDAPKPFPAP